MLRQLLKYRVLHLGLIALLAAVFYSRTLGAPLQWDETEFIVQNPIVQDLGYFANPSSAEGFKWHGAFVNRYVSYLTFALNYSVHGKSVFGYHAVNLVIHILASCALYWTVLLLFQSPRMRESTLDGRRVALWSALIFAAHPLGTEAVTYVFQRHASLAGLFYITSLALYLRWRISGSASGGRWAYAGAIIVALLAMKTKENAFTLPLAIALAEAVFFDGAWKRRVAYLVPLLLTMLVVPMGIWGMGSIVGDGASQQLYWDSPKYASIQPRVLMTYLRLFALPINQNLDYDYPAEALQILPLILLISFLAFGIWLMIKGRAEMAMAGFGIAWFFIAHAVESSVVPLPMLIAEYRMYIPGMGLCIASVVMVGRVIQDRRTSQAILAALVACLALLTLMRNETWRGKVTLWEDASRKSPAKARPRYQLGLALASEGRHKEAIKQFEEALEGWPDVAQYQNSLGVSYLARGDVKTAERHFEFSIRVAPEYAEAHFNLGITRELLGDPQEAMRQYRLALSLRPDFPDAHNNLGLLLLRGGVHEEAIAHFKEALALRRDYPAAADNLGIAYRETGRIDDAIRMHSMAVEMSPDPSESHYNLAHAYQAKGDLRAALMHYEKAVSLRQSYFEARNNAGVLAMTLGEHEKAIAHLEAAILLSPENAGVSANMADAYLRAGQEAKALAEAERALKLEPLNAHAREVMERMAHPER